MTSLRPAADQGVEAEAARCSSRRRALFGPAEPGQVAAVVARVAEEAGLVPFLETDPIADPVLL